MTRLTKPVTRLVDTSEGPMNVTLTRDGISFRGYKKRTTMLLPYGTAIYKAAWLKADQELAGKRKGRKRIRRGATLTRGR